MWQSGAFCVNLSNAITENVSFFFYKEIKNEAPELGSHVKFEAVRHHTVLNLAFISNGLSVSKFPHLSPDS